MARLIYGLNQSLDGYVDHDIEGVVPDADLFRHFIERVRTTEGSLYGRKIYEVMRYWDEQQPDWINAEQEFGNVWRDQQKWVVSRTLESVGPNATLINGDLEAEVKKLKAEHEGEIEVAGPELAASLTKLGLIDEYQIYLHPVVAGKGKQFFASPPPPLNLLGSERIGKHAIRLRYAPQHAKNE